MAGRRPAQDSTIGASTGEASCGKEFGGECAEGVRASGWTVVVEAGVLDRGADQSGASLRTVGARDDVDVLVAVDFVGVEARRVSVRAASGPCAE